MNRLIIDHDTGQVLPLNVTPRYNLKRVSPPPKEPKGAINTDLLGLIVCAVFVLITEGLMQ